MSRPIPRTPMASAGSGSSATPASISACDQHGATLAARVGSGRRGQPLDWAAVLRIDRATYDAIVAHARARPPGRGVRRRRRSEGTDRPERFIPMINAARSPTFYEFDSGDQLRLYREMDDRDEEPVVVYHSHTATEAYPSRTDVRYASEPERTTCWSRPATRRTGLAVRGRVPQLPDRRRRGHRGGRRGRRVLPVRPLPTRRLTSDVARRGNPWRRAASPVRRPRSHDAAPRTPRSTSAMAIEVRIPTILRTHTGGESRSRRSGGTLGALIDDLDTKHPGPQGPPGHRRRQAAPLRQRLRQRRGRALHRRPGHRGPDGDSVTILPAVAGGC